MQRSEQLSPPIGQCRREKTRPPAQAPDAVSDPFFHTNHADSNGNIVLLQPEKKESSVSIPQEQDKQASNHILF